MPILMVHSQMPSVPADATVVLPRGSLYPHLLRSGADTDGTSHQHLQEFRGAIGVHGL